MAVAGCRLWRGVVCALIAALAPGCGGDDDGSGIDSDKSLLEATDEEIVEMCEWYVGQLSTEDIVDFECHLVAAQLSGDVDECGLVFDECSAMATADGDGVRPTCLEPEELQALPACAAEVSVGDYQSCMAAFADQFADAAADASCGASVDDLLDSVDFLNLAECAALEEACPELLGEGGA
jgi:hypothetical protein